MGMKRSGKKCNTSDTNISQNCGWSISNVKIPAEGSSITLLKLSSVLSLIALRNDGVKKIAACIVYISLYSGYRKKQAVDKDNSESVIRS